MTSLLSPLLTSGHASLSDTSMKYSLTYSTDFTKHSEHVFQLLCEIYEKPLILQGNGSEFIFFFVDV